MVCAHHRVAAQSPTLWPCDIACDQPRSTRGAVSGNLILVQSRWLTPRPIHMLQCCCWERACAGRGNCIGAVWWARAPYTWARGALRVDRINAIVLCGNRVVACVIVRSRCGCVVVVDGRRAVRVGVHRRESWLQRRRACGCVGSV